jgi:hypothetical protein
MTTEQWAPARIWLQREQGDHGSHTWCEDSVGDGDIIEEAEYVRVDASQPKSLTDDLLVQLFYAAQGDITQFRIKARDLLEAAK